MKDLGQFALPMELAFDFEKLKSEVEKVIKSRKIISRQLSFKKEELAQRARLNFDLLFQLDKEKK
jgi:hypothetical protein